MRRETAVFCFVPAEHHHHHDHRPAPSPQRRQQQRAPPRERAADAKRPPTESVRTATAGAIIEPPHPNRQPQPPPCAAQRSGGGTDDDARARASNDHPASPSLSQSLSISPPPTPPITAHRAHRSVLAAVSAPPRDAAGSFHRALAQNGLSLFLSHLLDRGRGRRRRTDRRGCRRPSRPPRTAEPSICGGTARPSETPARCDRHETGPHETTSRVGTRHTQREDGRETARAAREAETPICSGAKNTNEERCAEPIEADGARADGCAWDASPPRRRTGGL